MRATSQLVVHCLVSVAGPLLLGSGMHGILGSLDEHSTDVVCVPVIVEFVATRDIAVEVVTVKGPEIT